MKGLSARASKSNDEVVIEIPLEADQTMFNLRMSFEQCGHLRKQLESAEKEISKRISQRGDHPLF